ncbi:GIY-YIG nuclease family protein [Roseateles violae]|uniref:GIY-YIG nuclease family protein n=1 Tax=Roseateles violae TaxID=3058042 RepID=UPI003312FECF
MAESANGGYAQNIGVAGVVYILENDGLREGWIKIGCSKRSGGARARDLNIDANTGTPGTFRCVFEARTLDCGLAEQHVFTELAVHRRGKRGQEFFEVDLGRAQAVIRRICAAVDQAAAALPAPQARASMAPRPYPTFRAQPQPPAALPVPAPQASPLPRVLRNRFGGRRPVRFRRLVLASLVFGVIWIASQSSDRADRQSQSSMAAERTTARGQKAPAERSPNLQSKRSTAASNGSQARAPATSASTAMPEGLPHAANGNEEDRSGDPLLTLLRQHESRASEAMASR